MRALVLSLAAASLDAASVSGTVYLRQGQTRAPLAGVAVTASLAEGSRQIPSTLTDQRGRYVVADLPAGRLLLTAAKPGYFARSVLSGDGELVLSLVSSELFANADFEVLSGGVITGRVTGQRGEPLDGASVLVFRSGDLHKQRRQPAMVTRSSCPGR